MNRRVHFTVIKLASDGVFIFSKVTTTVHNLSEPAPDYLPLPPQLSRVERQQHISSPQAL